MSHPADILDDLFQGCAFAAYLDQARAQGSWPDPELTRRRAYDYYEKALAERPQHSVPSNTTQAA
jgi:hypothetical protein